MVSSMACAMCSPTQVTVLLIFQVELLPGLYAHNFSLLPASKYTTPLMLKAKFEPGSVSEVPTCHVDPLPLVTLTNEGAMCVSELFVIELFSGMYSNGPGGPGPTPKLRMNVEEPPELLA